MRAVWYISTRAPTLPFVCTTYAFLTYLTVHTCPNRRPYLARNPSGGFDCWPVVSAPHHLFCTSYRIVPHRIATTPPLHRYQVGVFGYCCTPATYRLHIREIVVGAPSPILSQSSHLPSQHIVHARRTPTIIPRSLAPKSPSNSLYYHRYRGRHSRRSFDALCLRGLSREEAARGCERAYRSVTSGIYQRWDARVCTIFHKYHITNGTSNCGRSGVKQHPSFYYIAKI
jgi:hypothetical protein